MPCLTSMLRATTLLCVEVVSLWLSSVLLPPTLSVLMPRRCLTRPSIVDAENAALSNNAAAAREDDATRHACWPLGDTRCCQSAGLWTSPPEAAKSFATVQLAPAESAGVRPPAAMYPVLCAQAACLGDVCLFLRLMTTCCCTLPRLDAARPCRTPRSRSLRKYLSWQHGCGCQGSWRTMSLTCVCLGMRPSGSMHKSACRLSLTTLSAVQTKLPCNSGSTNIRAFSACRPSQRCAA